MSVTSDVNMQATHRDARCKGLVPVRVAVEASSISVSKFVGRTVNVQLTERSRCRVSMRELGH